MKPEILFGTGVARAAATSCSTAAIAPIATLGKLIAVAVGALAAWGAMALLVPG